MERKAVSSIATSFADHFFPAVIWHSLTSSPATLQSKKGSSLEASLIQAGFQGFLMILFLIVELPSHHATYFQQPLTTL